MGNQKTQKKANTVLIAGVLFNLSIGVLYAWSVLKTNMTASVLDGGWGWNSRQAGLPYTIAILCFASGVLIGGRIQDKAGPRWVVTAGGLMVGLGLVLSGLIGNNPGGIAVSFGVVSGLGIGIGYGCVTPAALKWFHPSRKGFVSGMVVGGFGLGAVYLAPLASALLRHFTIEQTKLVMGIAIMVISACVAQFIKNPPEGYVPIEPKGIVKSAKRSGVPADLTWREMMRTKRFYIMFFLYLFSASVGLMVLGNVTKIATLQAGITDAALLAGLVSFMAVMNFLGRIAGGMMSDKIGRTGAIFVVLGLQLINMSAFSFYNHLPAIISRNYRRRFLLRGAFEHIPGAYGGPVRAEKLRLKLRYHLSCVGAFRRGRARHRGLLFRFKRQLSYSLYHLRRDDGVYACAQRAS